MDFRYLISEVMIFDFQYLISEVSLIFDFRFFNFQYSIIEVEYFDCRTITFSIILVKTLFDIGNIAEYQVLDIKTHFYCTDQISKCYFDILITILYISTVTVFQVIIVKNLLFHSNR